MGLGDRTARRHESVAAASHTAGADPWLAYQPGQAVMTVDGFPGVVGSVSDGPLPGVESYFVTLDNGLGHGEYQPSQLSPLNNNDSTGSAHTAADDYPELGSVLTDHPDIAPNTVLAHRVQADEHYDWGWEQCPECGGMLDTNARGGSMSDHLSQEHGTDPEDYHPATPHTPWERKAERKGPYGIETDEELSPNDGAAPGVDEHGHLTWDGASPACRDTEEYSMFGQNDAVEKTSASENPRYANPGMIPAPEYKFAANDLSRLPCSCGQTDHFAGEHFDAVQKRHGDDVIRAADPPGCHCGQPGHTADQHAEWAQARHSEGTHDAWGRPLMQPYDGHGAWNCNNYNCTEHPHSMYEQGGIQGTPGWLEHDTSPDAAMRREVNQAMPSQDTQDANWLLSQQHEGPSKYSALLPQDHGEHGPWNAHGQCMKCGFTPHTEADDECDDEYCQSEGFPEGWHTKGEHMDPSHRDPGHEDYQSAEHGINEAFKSNEDAWLLHHQPTGPSKYSNFHRSASEGECMDDHCEESHCLNCDGHIWYDEHGNRRHDSASQDADHPVVESHDDEPEPAPAQAGSWDEQEHVPGRMAIDPRDYHGEHYERGWGEDDYRRHLKEHHGFSEQEMDDWKGDYQSRYPGTAHHHLDHMHEVNHDFPDHPSDMDHTHHPEDSSPGKIKVIIPGEGQGPTKYSRLQHFAVVGPMDSGGVCIQCAAHGFLSCQETVGKCDACGKPRTDIYRYRSGKYESQPESLCLNCIDTGHHLESAHDKDEADVDSINHLAKRPPGQGGFHPVWMKAHQRTGSYPARYSALTLEHEPGTMTHTRTVSEDNDFDPYLVTRCQDHGVKVTGDRESQSHYIEVAQYCHDEAHGPDRADHRREHNQEGDDCWSCCDKMHVASPGERASGRTGARRTNPWALVAEAAADPDFRFEVTAAWSDVRNKAKRIRSGGGVRVTALSEGMIHGEVRGDHHVYETGLQRLPGRQAIAAWACGCKWGAYHWGAEDDFSRFAGRMCSHALALQYEAQSRGMFGRQVSPDDTRPSWVPRTVVVKYDIDADRNVRAPGTPGRTDLPFAASRSAVAALASLARRQDESREEVLLAFAAAGIDAQGAVNDAWGEPVPVPTVYAPGPTKPNDPSENPASAGWAVGPEPESWNQQGPSGSVERMTAALDDDAMFEPEMTKEGFLPLLIPLAEGLLEAGGAAAAGEAAGGAAAAGAGEAAGAGAAGEAAGGGGGLLRTVGPKVIKNVVKNKGQDVVTKGLDQAVQRHLDNPAETGEHPLDQDERNPLNYGNRATLHDQPEGALPFTDSADPSDPRDPGTLEPEDPSFVSTGSVHSVDDVVAQFQATTAARTLSSGAQPSGSADIAAAARAYLETGETGQPVSLSTVALKAFTPAEQAQIINEGEHVTAANLDRLDIKGTHYEPLEAALAAVENDEEWMA